MKTVVLKFGGSSVANNEKLKLVVKKIINFKENYNVVVVVSAQGKMTNRLIEEALEISKVPRDREMDMLLSVGEQITASKLSIMLNKKGYKAISLTGWQAGIITNSMYQNAKIKEINYSRITNELEKGKIVVVTGFQGVDSKGNITTLGRGGSDTTAVSLAASLGAKCYIFSDVDGVYSADPRIVDGAKKLDSISYEEMQEAADAGAEVLHNRCIKIGSQFNCDIIAAGTFTDGNGTQICKEIEQSEVKSIVKNIDRTLFKIKKDGGLKKSEVFDVYTNLLKHNVVVDEFKSDKYIEFNVNKSIINKVIKIFNKYYENYKVEYSDIIKLSIVGYGITGDNRILLKTMNILNSYDIEILYVDLTQSKIEIVVKDINDSVVNEIHRELIEKEG